MVENARGDVLASALGSDSPLLEFARAVTVHLEQAAGLRSGRSVVQDIVATIRAMYDEAPGVAARMLARDAPMLASFFQNADLLPPDAPETADVAHLVMEAVVVAEGEAAVDG